MALWAAGAQQGAVGTIRVTAVTLDAYGTLFKGGSDDLISTLRRIHADARVAAPFEQFLARREALIGELGKREFVNMRGRDEWVLGTLFQEYNVPLDAKAVVSELNQLYYNVTPYPDAIACVDALRARGLRLAIVSNADVDMMTQILKSNDLLGTFDAVVTSEASRAYKPSPAIFESAARSLGAPPTDILHVGDSFVADVVGAKRAGFQAAWLNRPGGLPPPKKRDAKPDLKIDSLSKLPTKIATSG